MIDFFKNHKLKFILGSKGLLIVVFLTAVLSFMAVSAVEFKTNELVEQRKAVETKIVRVHNENVQIKEKIDNKNTKSGIKRIAMEDLDMTIKGAIVFEIVE